MESWKTNRMTQRSILLAVVIVMTSFFAESEGFFLKNFLSEAETEEILVSTTTLSPSTTSTDINPIPFDEIHRNVSEKIEESTQIVNTVSPGTISTDINRVTIDEIRRNVSEKFEESSTQIVNSVKDIVSSALDEHTTDKQTEHKLPEEDNQIDIDLRNIAVDGDNDIPSPEARNDDNNTAPPKGLLINLESGSDDLTLNIVKIPEANNKDIATVLEDNIRSSVKDEIQLEQNFESSASDVIHDIPDLEVRQTLTEDLMAMEYPQSVKNLEESSAESRSAFANEKDEIDSTETLIDVTTAASVNESSRSSNTSIALKEEILEDGNNTDLAETTTATPFETETTSDIEMTTTSNEIIQEITLIPSEEIVHNLEDLQDISSGSETKRTRHMRGFSEESDTNEVTLESQDSSKNTEDTESKSIDSLDSSNSSDSLANDSSKSFTKDEDENVASEETSEEVDKVISQDASIEESLENESFNTQEAITAESIPKRKVTPTPRPAISSTTTVEPFKSNSADPILVEGITESTGEILNKVSSTSSEGKHIVIKKPGVEEELTPLNATENPKVIALSDDAARESPIEPAVITEFDLKAGNETNFVVSNVLDTKVSIERVPEVAKSPGELLNDTKMLITENNLLETEDPIIHAESLDSTQYLKPVSLDSLTDSIPVEIHDNNTDQLLVSELEKTSTVDKSTQTSTPKGNELFSILDKSEDIGQHTSSQAPVLQTTHTVNAEKPSTSEIDQQDMFEQSDSFNIKRTLETDETDPTQVSFLENAPKTLNAEPVSVPRITLDTEEHVSSQTSFPKTVTVNEEDVETSTETPLFVFEQVEPNHDISMPSKPAFSNEISKHVDQTLLTQMPQPSAKDVEEELPTHHVDTINSYETSTEKPIGRSNEDSSNPALVRTLIEAAELTTEFARHVDSFRTTRDETSAISDEIVSPTVAGRSFNAIIAEGLGKPLPTRSVGDEPSTSSYSSEDRITTVVVLCSSAAVIFIAFSIAIYLITFQRQHGTLDIEMQEQRCGKDNLEDEEDAETRVTLLNQFPQMDSDEHSSD